MGTRGGATLLTLAFVASASSSTAAEPWSNLAAIISQPLLDFVASAQVAIAEAAATQATLPSTVPPTTVPNPTNTTADPGAPLGNTTAPGAAANGTTTVPAVTAPSAGGVGDSSFDRAGWEVAYVHQFECAGGAGLDSAVWDVQTGNGEAYGLHPGWGNNEPQTYTSEAVNLGVAPEAGAGDGCALHLTAALEADGSFTSARIRARPESPLGRLMPQAQADGSSAGVRIAVRALLPPGAAQGFWPAFWLLPTDQVYTGLWAATGEIDIMETINDEAMTHAALQYGGEWPNNEKVATGRRCGPRACRGEWHEWSLEWRAKELRWYTDSQLTLTVNDTVWFTTSADKALKPGAPFDVPFHLILNLAVGGDWPGYPDASAVFPQTVAVDYITVHREVLSITAPAVTPADVSAGEL